MAETVVALQNVSKSYGNQHALDNFTLHVLDGEFITLLGPSGCGKTTVLRLIGGFEDPDSGEIFLDGAVVTGLAPEKRTVNTVFQNYALFPHLTVYDNVAFGLRMAGRNEGDIRIAVSDALKQVRLEGMERRKPAMLSGGQQQRVAIARAIVNKPRVLLLDEPLSALDYRLRKDMQKELKALHQRLGITFILVTHDQDEAFTMSDRVVVMNHGHIEQTGSPREVYEEPVNLYVASFVGDINVLSGIVRKRNDCHYLVEIEGCEIEMKSDRAFRQDDRVHILLRPEDIRLEPLPAGDGSSGSSDTDEGILTGKVLQSFYRGATYDLTIEMKSGSQLMVTEFFDEDAETVAYAPGNMVRVQWISGWEVVLPHE